MVNKKGGARKSSILRHALLVTLGTFVVACFMSANSQVFLTNLQSPYLAFLLLVAVILVGIIFDVIGTAVTAADPTPFHSRAACRLAGAEQSLRLLNKADKVANFCNDVVGDICGTLSGGIGASIILTLSFSAEGGMMAWLPTALMAGLVAALTVGGKAYSKSYSIRESDQIVFTVGRIIFWFESIFDKDKKAKTDNKKYQKNR